MTMWFKSAVAALALAGSAFVATEPAQARVHVGVVIGGPGYYRGGYDPACDRYSRWYNPYRCESRYDDDYYDDGYYDGPIFIDGIFFDGGHWRHRHHRGHHQFWWRNQWHDGHMGHHGHHRRHH